MKRSLLGRVRVATGISAQLDGLEQEVHHAIYARKSHNVADEGCEVALCTALALHTVSFHEDLKSRKCFENVLPCAVTPGGFPPRFVGL